MADHWTLLCLVLVWTWITQSQSAMVDLSHPFEDGMLHYKYWEDKGQWKFNIIHRGIYANKYWGEWNNFQTVEHGGTHMDAPVHIHALINNTRDPSKWHVDDIPFHRLKGPGVVFDMVDKAQADNNYELTIDDITEYEDRYGRIPQGAITFMYTGWDLYYKAGNKEKYYGQDEHVSPGFGADAVEWLIDNRDIVGMGTDAGSIGPGVELAHLLAADDDYKGTHSTTLSRNVWGIENLANLRDIPPAGATIYALPIKIKRGSGGPCRVFAEWNTDGNSAASSVKYSLLAAVSSILIFLLY